MQFSFGPSKENNALLSRNNKTLAFGVSTHSSEKKNKNHVSHVLVLAARVAIFRASHKR